MARSPSSGSAWRCRTSTSSTTPCLRNLSAGSRDWLAVGQTSSLVLRTARPKLLRPMSKRTLTVTPAEEGRTLAEVLRARLGLPSSQVRRVIESGLVVVKGTACRDLRRVLRAGQKLHVLSIEEQRPRRSQEDRAKGAVPIIRYADPHVVVVEKPAGLTTMRHAHEAAEFGKRGQRFLPATLMDQL